jgi:glycolate oxidase iron-sulfur subunit
MQHRIPVEQLEGQVGAQIHGMAQAVESCVHCGFCLATCPTYRVLGEEMDSPRGRILLMKSVLEGELDVQEAAPYIDRCLGCLACVTACPSGVKYEQLLAPYRAYAVRRVKRSPMQRVQRRLCNETLPHPGRFRLAAGLGGAARTVQGALPEELRAMLAVLPRSRPSARPLPEVYPAIGTRRSRIALLAGCVQQILAPEINWATLHVLARNGVETVIPRAQGCCGSILMHTGEAEEARRLARENLRVFPQDVDAILTNAAGCGSGMKEYGHWFAGLPEQEMAGAFAGRVQDVSEFLDELGLAEPPPLARPLKIAYHDACHLAHAQGVREAPRRLLRGIPNLALVEIAEAELCCGSAGTYNVEQPDIAASLGRRKTENLLNSGGEAVACGNIGCMVQIRKHLDALGQAFPVYHTLEVLARAYEGGQL